MQHNSQRPDKLAARAAFFTTRMPLGYGVDLASLRQRAGSAFAMSTLLFLPAASACAWSAWAIAP